MKKPLWLLGMVIMTAMPLAAAAAEQYKIDPVHTTVGFGVKHMVVTTVHGEFNDFSGTILYDPQDVSQSSVTVTIQASSIDTDNQKRDDHLRSDDFLDATVHPEITFKSTSIEKTDHGFIATGDLTLRGVTKQVQIPFELAGPVEDPWGNVRIGVAGELTINRREFGLEWDNQLADGSMVVADNVKIKLDVQAARPKG